MVVLTEQSNKYPTEPLKCWNRAKELRQNFYLSIAQAKEKGAMLAAGSGGSFHAFTKGFGRDVIFLPGEPYGATAAFFHDFAAKTEEACEKAGIARDLCAYLRNYWGSILLDKYILPDGTVLDNWPKPDFLFTNHVCCSHAKWYQYASELEGDVPSVAIDMGPRVADLMTDEAIDYFVNQLSEAIEYLEKAIGRKFDDEAFIEAADNELASLSMWADIYTLNQNIPAPLDEKSMFSLYVFGIMCPHLKEVTEFYRELRDEVKDRVARGIAAVSTERYRIATDSQPPWGFLNVFRHLESYGAVSVGSVYSWGLVGIWDREDDGRFIPMKTPREKGITPKNRQEALRLYVEHKMKGSALLLMWSTCHAKSDFFLQFVRDWKVDGVIVHLNRGCEGTAVGQMENRLALIEAGIPVVTYEGNMADNRDFDYARTLAKIEAFLDSQGLKKLN